jgi:hypothetical protein
MKLIKITLASSNKVVTGPTPGTKCSFVTDLEGPGGITKKPITIGGIVFAKGSIVKNLPGGVFILDPKADATVSKVENQSLGRYYPKHGYSVRRTEELLNLIVKVL